MVSEIIDRTQAATGGTEILSAAGHPRRVSLVREGTVPGDTVYAGFESGIDPSFKVTEEEPQVFVLPAYKPLYAKSTPTGNEYVSGTAVDLESGYGL